MIFAIATIVALLVGAAGAIWDIMYRRLPNMLCLIFAFTAMASLIGIHGLATLYEGLGHGLTALVIGAVLFRIGMIGGGDAKFYAAAATGLPFEKVLSMLGWTSVTGLCLLVAMALVRRMRGLPVVSGPDGKSWSVPYGVAIFGGFAATIARDTQL